MHPCYQMAQKQRLIQLVTEVLLTVAMGRAWRWMMRWSCRLDQYASGLPVPGTCACTYHNIIYTFVHVCVHVHYTLCKRWRFTSRIVLHVASVVSISFLSPSLHPPLLLPHRRCQSQYSLFSHLVYDHLPLLPSYPHQCLWQGCLSSSSTKRMRPSLMTHLQVKKIVSNNAAYGWHLLVSNNAAYIHVFVGR